MADYYELLGVSRTAGTEEIKRAYRRKARELHPDANDGDSATAERFKEVARAYQVLSDPEQRERYDRFGEAGVGGPERAADGRRLLRRPERPVRRLLRRAEPVRRRRRPAPAGRTATRAGPRDRRRHHVRTGGLRGDRADHVAAAPALRGLWRKRRRIRHPAGDVRRLRRVRPGAAGAPEPARADGHERAVPALRRARRGRRHPVPHLPGRGPGDERAHLPGRRARRRRHRLDAAPQRTGRRRTAGRQDRRPVRPPARRPARAVPARRQRPRHRRAHLDRPGGARHDHRPAHARR